MTEIMPVMLVGQTLPILLRRGGASMDEVGAFYLLMAPWALKFLWAPLIDRYGSSSYGRYRSWLLWVHPMLILSMLGLSLIDLPALLFRDFGSAAFLLALLTILCATADTAADGIAIGLLTPEERGDGNGFQMAGTMMGNFIGGGLLLILIGWLGWSPGCLILALLLVPTLVGVWWYHEPPRLAPPMPLREVLAPLRWPRMRRWILFVMCMEASYAISYTPMQAILSDHGYSLEEVGVIMGLVGSVAGVMGGAAGAICLNRFGRRGALFGLAGLTMLCISSLFIAAPPTSGRWVVYLSISGTIFSLMSLGTVTYTMMMDRARANSASSDYTTQYCMLQLASFLAMALGGYLTESVGPRAVFLLAPVLMVIVFLSARRYLSPEDFRADPLPQLSSPL